MNSEVPRNEALASGSHFLPSFLHSVNLKTEERREGMQLECQTVEGIAGVRRSPQKSMRRKALHREFEEFASLQAVFGGGFR